MSKTKYISSPERLWELFLAYKQQVKENPVLVEDYVGKDGDRVMRQREQPLIMEGFECYVMDCEVITYPDLTEYFEGKNKSYSEYFPISSRIKREIRFDQIKLGLANVINPSITQRLNGLTEKSENTNINKNFDVTMDLGDKKPESE